MAFSSIDHGVVSWNGDLKLYEAILLKGISADKVFWHPILRICWSIDPANRDNWSVMPLFRSGSRIWSLWISGDSWALAYQEPGYYMYVFSGFLNMYRIYAKANEFCWTCTIDCASAPSFIHLFFFMSYLKLVWSFYWFGDEGIVWATWSTFFFFL